MMVYPKNIVPIQAANHPKRLVILGSTGTIGKNTLDLVRRNNDAYQVMALTAFSNAELLAEQAILFGARRAVIADNEQYNLLKTLLAGTDIEVASGEEAMCEAASMEADWVMAGIVGLAGLAPTLAAVKAGRTIALANKECLVAAGDIFMQMVTQHHATLLPVDSEHNAIFQVLTDSGKNSDALASITLTASGGPFLHKTRDEMASVTPEMAVRHPNWTMGAKISVDSATMMNKGLELIEAYHLFPVSVEQIDVLVHPESILHGAVTYKDGTMLAALSQADMRIPIAYALAWPERMKTPVPTLDLAALTSLNFYKPDLERFPALGLARAAAIQGGTTPAALNAANEVAVAAFLLGKIGFLDIVRIAESALEQLPSTHASSLEAIYAADAQARRLAETHITKIKG